MHSNPTQKCHKKGKDSNKRSGNTWGLLSALMLVLLNFSLNDLGINTTSTKKVNDSPDKFLQSTSLIIKKTEQRIDDCLKAAEIQWVILNPIVLPIVLTLAIASGARTVEQG